jgi:hypothetical protein
MVAIVTSPALRGCHLALMATNGDLSLVTLTAKHPDRSALWARPCLYWQPPRPGRSSTRRAMIGVMNDVSATSGFGSLGSIAPFLPTGQRGRNTPMTGPAGRPRRRVLRAKTGRHDPFRTQAKWSCFRWSFDAAGERAAFRGRTALTVGTMRRAWCPGPDRGRRRSRPCDCLWCLLAGWIARATAEEGATFASLRTWTTLTVPKGKTAHEIPARNRRDTAARWSIRR